MSQYSQMIGSFQRTGDYPMESDYIFETVEDLEEYYSDEINKATLHPGLLRVVLNDHNKQALYWTCLQDGELNFIKLMDADDIDSLQRRMQVLSEEVANLMLSDYNSFQEMNRDISQRLQTTQTNLSNLSNTFNTFQNLTHNNITNITNAITWEEYE